MLLRDVRPAGRDARTSDPVHAPPGTGDGIGKPDGVMSSADTADDPDDDLGYFATLRAGIVEAVGTPAVRSFVLLVAAIAGLDALEEYFTLIALDWGVPVPWIPMAELAIPLAGAAATWWVAHRSPSKKAFAAHTLAFALGSGALLLALSEWFGHAAGLAGVAAYYALYRVVLVAVNTRLQDAITGPARATVSSVASLLSELSAIAIYGLWALDGLPLIAVLILLLALTMPLAMRRRTAPRQGDDRPSDV
jgi:hypothetical protein